MSRILKGFAVLVFGSMVIYGILKTAPELTGVNENQHALIDVLEQSGALPFSSVDLNNEAFSLGDFKGRMVILSFWATWCAPCVEEFPSLLKLIRGMDSQVVLVAISYDADKDDVLTFLQSFNTGLNEKNVIHLMDQDESIKALYQVGRLPESFVFNKEHKLVKKIVGTIDWANEDAFSFFKFHLKTQEQ